MDLAKKSEEGEVTPQPRVFINPEILSSSEETSVYEEGCLSIPEYYEEVERPAKVRVRFTDLDGKVHEEDAEGLYATCIQHEIDHLNGVLFVDYLSKLKRDRVLKKFTKAAKRAGGYRADALARSASLLRGERPRVVCECRLAARVTLPHRRGNVTSRVMSLRLIFMGTPELRCRRSWNSWRMAMRSPPSIRARQSLPAAA